ncbi:MAG: RIP metalloprotease [Vulcanimicrobiota bacterium]
MSALSSIFQSPGAFFSNLLALLVVILSFGFIIFIHELGHFIMAKRVGVRVYEFALGFGLLILTYKKDEEGRYRPCWFPTVKKKKEKEITGEDAAPEPFVDTEYSLRLFPFGGFVRMEGEDEPATDPNDKGHFQNKTPWERVKIILWGPLMNYIAALLIFWVGGLIFGVGQFYLQPRVGAVIKGMPAEKSGISPGDVIMTVNGVAVNDYEDLVKNVNAYPDQDIAVEWKRGEGDKAQFFTKTIHTDVKEMPEGPGEPARKIGVIGIMSDETAISITVKRLPFGEVIKKGAVDIVRFSASPYIIYKFFVTAPDKKKVMKEIVRGSAGPLGIAMSLFQIAKKGFPQLLYFLGVINALIGVFNLIPFPALDGCRAFLLIISGIIRKPLNPEKEGLVHLVGFFILIVVMIFFTANDIQKALQGVTLFK